VFRPHRLNQKPLLPRGPADGRKYQCRSLSHFFGLRSIAGVSVSFAEMVADRISGGGLWLERPMVIRSEPYYRSRFFFLRTRENMNATPIRSACRPHDGKTFFGHGVLGDSRRPTSEERSATLTARARRRYWVRAKTKGAQRGYVRAALVNRGTRRIGFALAVLTASIIA